MSNERVIPNEAQSKSDFITFDILSEGAAIDPTYQVISVSVSKEANRIPSAKLVIVDGDPSEETFEISSADVFIPGKKITIKAGRDGNNEVVFKGVVVKHAIKVGGSGGSSLVVDCKDECVKMTLGRKNKYFEEKKDSEIIQELLGGFAGDVKATKVKHKEVVQHYSTDWDFVMMRAEVNGMLVLASDGKVDIAPPETASPALTLIYGATVIDFEAEMESRYQWKAVEGKSWDYADQALFQAESSSSSFKEFGNLDGSTLSDAIGLDKFELRHSGHLPTEELQAWADAAMLKSRLAKIRGKVKFKGTANVKPGVTVELKGFGDRFNGKAYITGIRHELVNGGWLTTAQFGLEPDWFARNKDITEAPAAGLLPGINGLHIGKVVKLEEDPDGEHRIQVKLPIIDNDAKGIWARAALLDAGANRGTFWRPEVDDEVIVGFINNDPRDAVVLGMLHSSAKPAPLEAKDTNHEKGIFTRENMRVLFNDETKTITIDTPAGNHIIIDEDTTSIEIKDQNDNKIVLNDKGIEINSPKDIKIEAGGKIDIKAAQDLKAEGLNVGIKASAKFEAEGSAGATLKTSAIAEVKGSLVKIN